MSDQDDPKPTPPPAEVPAPPATAVTELPPTPHRGPPLVLFIGLALLLSLGVGLLLTNMGAVPSEAPVVRDATPGAAGGPASVAAFAGPDVTLGLVVEAEGKQVDVGTGSTLLVGDTVTFQLSAQSNASVRVWVERDGHPAERLGTFEATPESGMLSEADGLLAWSLGAPGTVIFKASAAPEGCPDSSCDSVVITVR